MKSKHLRGYILASSGCITAACGGTFFDGGTADMIFGITLIVVGMVSTVMATVVASVIGPDPRLWEPINGGGQSGKGVGSQS